MSRLEAFTADSPEDWGSYMEDIKMEIPGFEQLLEKIAMFASGVGAFQWADDGTLDSASRGGRPCVSRHKVGLGCVA